MKNAWMLLAVLLLLGGCDFNPFKDDPAFEEKTAQPTEEPKTAEPVTDPAMLKAEQEKAMAQIAMQKELADIEKQKAIELGELDQAVKMREAELHQKIELEQMKVKVQLAEEERLYALQRNMMLLAGLLILIMAYGLYVLLKRRHDNKLRAYNDNLQKYFRHKENETRAKLAEKIIDKIADGKTPTAQEQKLIEILKGVSSDNVQSGQDDVEETPVLIDKPSSSSSVKDKL